MSELYDRLLEQLQQDGSSTPEMFDEPTGWAKVDRAATEIRQRLEQATTEEQFQAVGTLCREALISLAQAVCDSAQHPTLDSVKASPTDFKRMIAAYSAAELAGASKEASRRHAKAAFDVANELQHKRTADFRHAALLRSNCRSHKSHCDWLRSLRPLAKEPLWTMMMNGQP